MRIWVSTQHPNVTLKKTENEALLAQLANMAQAKALRWADLADDTYVDTYVDEAHRSQRAGDAPGVDGEVGVGVGVGVGNDRLDTLQVLLEMGGCDGGKSGDGEGKSGGVDKGKGPEFWQGTTLRYGMARAMRTYREVQWRIARSGGTMEEQQRERKEREAMWREDLRCMYRRTVEKKYKELSERFARNERLVRQRTQ